MSVDFNGPSTEIFQVIRSYNYEVVLFDEDGNQVYEPEEARRFFCKPNNMLVSVIDDGDNSAVRLYISRSTDIDQIRGLIDTLRLACPKYNLLFNVRKYGRELSPKDFATKHSVREDRKPNEVSMKVFEGMYGTTRSSYLKLENARMIVRHSERVNEDMIGSRGRNIQAIFVENDLGERRLFPVNNISAARAMTQHVNQGGQFDDPVGQRIVEMAKDFANLGTINRHVQAHGHNLSEEAFGLRDEVREKMREHRRCFERMFRPGGYASEAYRINEQANMLSEQPSDPQVQQYKSQVNRLRDLLTVEGVELAETMLESVARVLHEQPYEPRDERMIDEDEIEEAPRPVEIGMTRVVGMPVGKQAWEDFRRGKMDMRKRPELPGTPQFKSRSAELSFKLGAVAEVVRDDTLGNFLSSVNNRLQDPKGNAAFLNDLRRIGVKALDNAGMPLSENFRPQSQAIREFNDWINGIEPMQEEFVDGMIDEEDVPLGTPNTFTFESTLRGAPVTITATSHPAVTDESGEHQRPPDMSIDKVTLADGRDVSPEQLGEEMDRLQAEAAQQLAQRMGDDPFEEQNPDGEMVEGSMDSLGSAGMVGGNTVFSLIKPGERFRFPNSEEVFTKIGATRYSTPDGRKFSTGRNVAVLTAEAVAEDMPEPDEEYDPDMDETLFSAPAGSVMPGGPATPGLMGAPSGQMPGGSPTPGLMGQGCGDDALGPEDIILPTNMGADLAGEVTRPTDAAEIDRMRLLAGLKQEAAEESGAEKKSPGHFSAPPEDREQRNWYWVTDASGRRVKQPIP